VTVPAVSIVLPTRNGATTLPAVLQALGRQRVNFTFETIAVDSESTDGTAELLRRGVDRLLSIPARTFDHGVTRNVGIAEARGSLVVLLVQDAEPVGDTWLSALTAPLLADQGLAGTFARQQARADAPPVVRHYLSRYAGASETARVASLPATSAANALDALPPSARLDLCTFDNVCSCIRRSVWTSHPFKSTPIAEDVEWAREVLLAGHRLAFVPEAVVIHSHDRPASYELMRTFALHRRLYELFRLRTIPTMTDLLRAIASSLAVHARCERESARTMPSGRALALAVAWPLGQYLGALAAVRGWRPRGTGGR
jgi:rhamnosyltransferase